MVQYRDKSKGIIGVRQEALEIQRILKPWGIPFILNNYVELAAEINADGVHIGQTDMPILQARRILGEDKIIGISIEHLDNLKVTNALAGLYYVTASAVFTSKTKTDCRKIWDIEGLEEVVKNSMYPVTGIGGITCRNAKKVKKTGAVGFAVVGAIHDAANPEEAAYLLRREME